jgi:hypothetical protein
MQSKFDSKSMSVWGTRHMMVALEKLLIKNGGSILLPSDAVMTGSISVNSVADGVLIRLIAKSNEYVAPPTN